MSQPSRKPAHLEMVGGKSKRQRVWEAIRALRNPITVLDIACKAEVDAEMVKTYLQSLEKGGYLRVEVKNRGGHSNKVWSLQKDVGAEAPCLSLDGAVSMRGKVRTHIWRVLRIAKEDFDYLEVAIQASTPQLEIKSETVRKYLATLHLAGYLEQVSPSQPWPGVKWGKKPARFRLLPLNSITHKKPGPRAPLVQTVRQVYDPNWAEVVCREEPDDE